MPPAPTVPTRLPRLLVWLAVLGTMPSAFAEEDSRFSVEEQPGRLVVKNSTKPIAVYVYVDDKVRRPYFANVHEPGGTMVSRHYPPRDGQELTDHATMHPGIALGFGDVSGADFWRNQAKVEHVEFVEKPRTENGKLVFAVRNRYVSGEKTICTEVCRHALERTKSGYLLTYDSTFTGETAFVFGDQEEMGLGVRVAGPLQVVGGKGRIVNAEGHTNEKDVWGKPSDWCEYGGLVDGKRIGVLLMPHPQNFRKSWFHARDYGFMAANPFGRKSFNAGEPSKVTVQPNERFRLRFGVLIYSLPEASTLDAKAEFQAYVAATTPPSPPSNGPKPPTTGEM